MKKDLTMNHDVNPSLQASKLILNHIYQGNNLDVLKELPDKSINCCITSPPYYGLRDYGTGKWVGGNPDCPHRIMSKYSPNTITGHAQLALRGNVGDAIYKTVCPLCGAVRVDEQIGLEETPEEYIQRLVDVFHEVKRVLKDDGTLWLNIGDSYYSNVSNNRNFLNEGGRGSNNPMIKRNKSSDSVKQKDLIGIPWMLAKALRDPYYTGTIKNETDRVWIAAMLDAEGCITMSNYITGGKQKTNIYISITNSSNEIIKKCEKLFPQERKHIYEKDGVVRKKVYRWDVEGLSKKEQFLREIYPHLVAKKKQCIVGYTFLQLQKGLPSKKKGYTEKQKEQRRELTGIIHRLNAGEDVELPDYCVEPSSLYEPMFYLRQDIIWHKTNPMPESVKDRCTKSHEYIFLLSKSPKYYFDNEAIKEDAKPDNSVRDRDHTKLNNTPGRTRMGGLKTNHYTKRNKRDVWTVSTKPFKEAHFATFPEALIEPCILAGCPKGGVVLDPFFGSGTTGYVATKYNRKYVGIELNPKYIDIAKKRLGDVQMDLLAYL